jgi:hypothetical protein
MNWVSVADDLATCMYSTSSDPFTGQEIHGRFPWDEHRGYSPRRGHGEYWEDQFGYPDTDDEQSLSVQEYPCGIGGEITWLMREGQ